MKKWLEFDKSIREPGKKTDHFFVANVSNGVTVGQIYWYGGFRKYVFAPYPNMILDSGCMIEIARFLQQLMEDWYKERALRKSIQNFQKK